MNATCNTIATVLDNTVWSSLTYTAGRDVSICQVFSWLGMLSVLVGSVVAPVQPSFFLIICAHYNSKCYGLPFIHYWDIGLL